MDFSKISKIKGYDDNDNEVLTFDGVELKNIEFSQNIIDIITGYGITAEQLIEKIQILLSFGVSTYEFMEPEPASDEDAEIPNQNMDLEIFGQNVSNDNCIIWNSNIM